MEEVNDHRFLCVCVTPAAPPCRRKTSFVRGVLKKEKNNKKDTHTHTQVYIYLLTYYMASSISFAR